MHRRGQWLAAGNDRWVQGHTLPSRGCKVRRGQRPLACEQSLQTGRVHCKAQWATMGYITWAVLYGAPEALAPRVKDRPRGKCINPRAV